ncbi:hypothetical protein [Paenibacillus monticola]|uniref:Uncharacterized protein n=1 Tax=Paenibacillus monticola TaxID=2666075 RepID=A0A7X2H5P2_9BACL|nr:hypothetical protein [Paenibacillus monticola]MRN53923.1 hypothetical protein [Paenibacillus monticola]
MKERTEVINLCKQVLENSEQIKVSNDNHEIIRKVAEFIFNRTREIYDICNVEKYNVFFNGIVGVGKSTAICNLFNLIDKRHLKPDEEISNLVLLRTSSGRTTACETEIIQSIEETSKVIVTAVTGDEFKAMLEEYVSYLINKSSYLSVESIRILDNMLELSPSDSIEERFSAIKDRFDLHDEASSSDKGILLNYLINYIKYEERTLCEYTIEDANTEYSLKELFQKINNGLLKSCPYPKQIRISLSKKHFDLKLPEFIDKVVDTRGIDSGDRKDIQDSIKSHNNITIMCDRISDFSSNPNILSIMKQVLIPENKDDNKRVFLVGLERGNELRNVESSKKDKDIGIKKKTGDALTIFNTEKINFQFKNIFFYTPFNGLKIVDGEEISTVDENKYIEEQNLFFTHLKKQLVSMYLDYSDELSDFIKMINSLRKNYISELTLQKFDKVKGFTHSLAKQLQDITIQFNTELESDIKKTHASKVRAMVNNDGEYGNYSIYTVSERLGGESFQLRVSNLKSQLLGNIEAVFEDDDEIEVICKKTLYAKIEEAYLTMYMKNRTYYYNSVKNPLNISSHWQEPKKYWGQKDSYGNKIGNYRNRVVKNVLENITKLHIDIIINASKNYDEFFVDVIDFLQFE